MAILLCNPWYPGCFLCCNLIEKISKATVQFTHRWKRFVKTIDLSESLPRRLPFSPFFLCLLPKWIRRFSQTSASYLACCCFFHQKIYDDFIKTNRSYPLPSLRIWFSGRAHLQPAPGFQAACSSGTHLAPARQVQYIIQRKPRLSLRLSRDKRGASCVLI